MILVVDNYDSFTFNLVAYLRTLGAAIRVERNDEVTLRELSLSGVAGIVISPGPGRPEDAGLSLAMVEACARDGVPLLGVCLGHQVIGQHFGAQIVPSPRVMHGKVCEIFHEGSDLFERLPAPFEAARYHSLCIDRETLPPQLRITAEAADGTVQGIAHAWLPIHGVQFHPESVASEHGLALLRNFLDIARVAPA
jgi:anthranilate synthase component II